MKKLLYIVQYLLIISLFSEVIEVPGYNYSVYPLEGWVLQPYESESNLSWLSADNNVAFSITSWSGDEYESINSMFKSLTSGLDASGDFVPYFYKDYECAIGEITFKLGDINHKGWMIFMNGDDYDYHLVSFTLEENFKMYYNEIQSILDSFSPGSWTAEIQGPISSFLDQSPSRVESDKTIDFFGHKLTVPVATYDYGNSQAVIEREASIMGQYAYDPENFYKAWIRYYQIVIRDNFLRLEPLYKSLTPYFANNKYSNYDLTEILMFWIQSFNYSRNLNSSSDLLNPLESAITKTGDCDARSIVLGILLKKFGIDSILLASEKAKHALLAVDIPGEGSKFEYRGKEYLMVELTTKSLIGEIDESLKDATIWTPVELEFINGN